RPTRSSTESGTSVSHPAAADPSHGGGGGHGRGRGFHAGARRRGAARGSLRQNRNERAMNQLGLIVLLLLADDSTLVKAAKANGGLKKPMPKKTITNKDVKKSTGKITELPPGGAPASTPAGPQPTSVAEFEAKKKAIAAAEKRVADGETTVSDLEKELARVEQ